MEQLTTYTIDDFLSAPEHSKGLHTAMARDYVVLEQGLGTLLRFNHTPPAKHFRFEGLLITFVRKGTLHVGMEDQVFTASENSLFAIPPLIPAKIGSDSWGDVEFTALYISREFLQNLSFSLSAFTGPVVLEHRSPVCSVDEMHRQKLESYFRLLVLAARETNNPRLLRHEAASLCVAILYCCINMFVRQLELSGGLPQTAGHEGQRGRSSHVRDFIRMVHTEFGRQRSVSYYASALCVSPKYLSALVKATTGRTAARWIEEYVIMEAKNLLRYSGKNVQQVAYALNFPNQSAFGKYFKHITGMSPTEFQKG